MSILKQIEIIVSFSNVENLYDAFIFSMDKKLKDLMAEIVNTFLFI